eukprot:gene8173-44189_t
MSRPRMSHPRMSRPRIPAMGCFDGPVWAGVEFRDPAARAQLAAARAPALRPFGWSDRQQWVPH